MKQKTRERLRWRAGETLPFASTADVCDESDDLSLFRDDAAEFGSADGTGAVQRVRAVFQDNTLRIGYFTLRLAFDAISCRL